MKRRCRHPDCITLLSASNPGDRCRTHTPDEVWREATRRARSRGLAFAAAVDTELSPADVAAFWSEQWL